MSDHDPAVIEKGNADLAREFPSRDRVSLDKARRIWVLNEGTVGSGLGVIILPSRCHVLDNGDGTFSTFGHRTSMACQFCDDENGWFDKEGEPMIHKVVVPICRWI